MTTPSGRRPRGRPQVPDEAKKRNNVTIRMRDELKSKIQQAAAEHGRSISEEIERRLEHSFSAFGDEKGMNSLVSFMDIQQQVLKEAIDRIEKAGMNTDNLVAEQKRPLLAHLLAEMMEWVRQLTKEQER